MEIKRSNGKYLAVKVPEGSYDFDLHIPYHNKISFKTGKKLIATPGTMHHWTRAKGRCDLWGKEIEFDEVNFIVCEDIKPNTGIRYKILGLISEIRDNKEKENLFIDLVWNHFADIIIGEYSQWLIIKTS